MKKIKRVFLDIDGVCNRFHYHVFQHLGVPFQSEADYPHHLPEIVEAANSLMGFAAFTPAKFWGKITREVWATCPVSREFGYLLGFAEHLVGKKNVFFLTAPIRDPDCLAGKVDWINTYAPDWMRRQYIITPHKSCCAKPGHLLIDDLEKNTVDFIENGGSSILVPRPWNCLWHVNTAEYLAARLNKCCG